MGPITKMNRYSTWAIALCMAALALSSSAVAQDEASQQRTPRRPGSASGVGATGLPDGLDIPERRPAAEDTRPIDEVVKDFTKVSGVVTFYRQKKGATDTLYMEVPESALGKLYLLQITSGSGLGDTSNPMVYHGMPIDDVPIRIEKVEDNKLVFVKPNLAHRSTVPEVQRMIARSFPGEILGTFDIRSRQASRKSYLIEVGPFFKSDVADLSKALEPGGGALAGLGAGGYALNSAQSYIDQLKAFPENAVIHTVYTLSRRAGTSTPKAVNWSVSFNLSELPENNGYKPRLGDPRVGFFTQNFQTLDDQSSRDQNINYIERWQLEKADPTAALSKPKKPIVYYIDNAVPKEYREDVKNGILIWNTAFEKVGFKDAIEVRQMPDNADWDIADISHNVVRWTTGMPFAIALMRANPLTGQILNACINFDGVFAAGANGEFDEIVDPTKLYGAPVTALPGKYAVMACDYPATSARIANEGEVLFDALQTPGAPFNRTAYIHQRLTEVVAHEMGHCLGLRHNFIASAEISLKQLGDAKFVKEHGTSASVMDYVPYNVAALKKNGVDYYQTVLGVYDKFAIQYGYTAVDAQTPQGERYKLSQIASNGSLPEHHYQSDGTADDYDPLVVRYDMASDPLEWASRQMDVAHYLLVTATNRRLKSGTSYYEFTRSFTGALNTYTRAAAYIPRWVGGVRLSNSYVGDPKGQAPVTAVDAPSQRKALNLLDRYVFSESALQLPKGDLDKLTSNPNAVGNEANGRTRLFPIRSTISAFQTTTLEHLFSNDVLNRVSNNEFRSSSSLALPELFDNVDHSVWSELKNGHEISALRRDLQRAHLSTMVHLVTKDTGAPADARSLARAELGSLRDRVAAARPKAKGKYAAAYLSDVIARIDQALQARLDISEDAPTVTAPIGRRGG